MKNSLFLLLTLFETNPNEITITKFYSAFANGEAYEMYACYHPKIQFSDPTFVTLKGNEACKMWKILIGKSKENLKIDYSDIKADQYIGSAQWITTFRFNKSNRKVVNNIDAQFQFQDGLIIKHTDDFDI